VRFVQIHSVSMADPNVAVRAFGTPVSMDNLRIHPITAVN
jgi:hypothetical protein